MSSNAASLGEAVAIWCSSQGYPKPICRIYHESALVKINESVYVIRNFTVANQGEYICNCSNAAGAEEVNVTLYLYGELWCRTLLNLTQNTTATAMRTSQSKACYEQDNGCARAL